MSILNSAVPTTVFPAIDSRSFHVFEFRGDKLLFDRATGTTSELNGLAYELLQLIQDDIPVSEAIGTVCAKFGDADPQDLADVLNSLKSRGFFRFQPVEPLAAEGFDVLWNHKPRRIQMLMAEGCNLGCRYCYQWRNGTNQRRTLMPWKIARTAVDYLVWRSGGREHLQVTFFGGEPLLNYPMIKRVVKYCRRIERSTGRKFLFELITNGTLLSKDVVDFIVKEKFLLFISIDGWREMHEYNRPALHGEDLYETIVKNAVYANEQYEKHGLPRVKVRANLTNRFHDKQKVSKYLESLGFRFIGVGAVEPLPHGDPSPSAMSEDQMDELHDKSTEFMIACLEKLRRGERLSTVESRAFSDSSHPLSKRGILGVTCGVCRNTAVVDNRGNMYPCHRYGEMEAYRIGNVFTGLDRELVLDYYRRINTRASTECHDCWIRDYCGGGCAWLLSDKEGKIHSPTTRECQRRRNSMELGLWLRKELRQSFPQKFQDQPSPDAWAWDCTTGDEEPIPGVQSGTIGQMRNRSASPSALSSTPRTSNAPVAAHGSGGCGSGCGCSSQAAEASPMNPLLPVLAASPNHSSAGGCSSCSDCGPGGGCGSNGTGEGVFVIERRTAP